MIFFFFQAEDGIRDFHVTGVQTCALPILARSVGGAARRLRTVLVPAQAGVLPLALHLAPRVGAAAALRPADAVRREGAAARGDDQRARHRVSGGAHLMPQPVDSLKGFALTFSQLLSKP